MLAEVQQAKLVLDQVLDVHPPPPLAFAYFDQQLMTAVACINDDVAAFYDGALHLVAAPPRYPHHALSARVRASPTNNAAPRAERGSQRRRRLPATQPPPASLADASPPDERQSFIPSAMDSLDVPPTGAIHAE